MTPKECGGCSQSSGRRDRSHAGPGRRSEEAKRNEASSSMFLSVQILNGMRQASI